MREVGASVVMHGFGRLLGSSQGTELTYKLSKEAHETIDCFISHNWCVGRPRKFLTLALYFNGLKAFCVAMVVMILVAFLTAWGRLPTVECSFGTCGVMCWTLTSPVFLLTILFGHEMDYLLGRPIASVFLDKVCIHQSDPGLKAEGISKLGAFILRSSDMLVCYGDDYLRKLWTVYELGCYLSIHRSKSVILVPVAFAPFLIGILIFMYVCVPLSKYSGLDPLSADLFLIGFGTIVARVGATGLFMQFKRIHDTVEDFHIRHTTCFDDRDRGLVEGNIVDCMKTLALVPNDVSHDVAISYFNHMVRARVPSYLVKSMGNVGVPWHILVMFGGLVELPGSIDNLVAVTLSKSLRANILDLCHHVLKSLTLLPLWFALEAFIVKRCVAAPGKLAGIALCVSYPISVSLLAAIVLPSSELRGFGAEADIAVVGFAIFHVGVAACTVLAYDPTWLPRPWRAASKTSTDVASQDALSDAVGPDPTNLGRSGERQSSRTTTENWVGVSESIFASGRSATTFEV